MRLWALWNANCLLAKFCDTNLVILKFLKSKILIWSQHGIYTPIKKFKKILAYAYINKSISCLWKGGTIVLNNFPLSPSSPIVCRYLCWQLLQMLCPRVGRKQHAAFLARPLSSLYLPSNLRVEIWNGSVTKKKKSLLFRQLCQ